MKKELLYLLMACLMTCPVFTSCSDDDDAENESEMILVEHFDQQAYLQESLAEVDESGQLVSYRYGCPLDAANPTCLSVQADDLQKAKTEFKQLFSPDVKFVEADGGITANLTDEAGNSQGYVSFMPTTGEADGAIARVTFHTTPEMKFISELRYLAVWDDNEFSFSPIEEGEIVERATPEGWGRWVCVQEASPGRPGLLVYCSQGENGGANRTRYAPLSLVSRVADIVNKDWNRYYDYFRAAGHDLFRSYWIGEPEGKGMYALRYIINLRNGRTYKKSVIGSNYPFMLVECFSVVTVE